VPIVEFIDSEPASTRQSTNEMRKQSQHKPEKLVRELVGG
jgi:hypothetical protein